MKRRITAVLLLMLMTLTVALGGCAGDKQGENSSQITVGIPQDLEESLDPNKIVAAGTKEVLFNVFEGLVKPDSQGNIIPAVASDYVMSNEGKRYTFTLRDGIKFHDGEPVTVGDIKYSLEKCADATNGDPLVPAFLNIKSVNILDKSTVEVNLREPDIDFLASAAMVTAAITPAHNENPDTVPIGTGPYKFVSRSPQENIIMERFDDYWGKRANIKDVTFKICANTDTWVMDMKGGSVDMFARMPIAQAEQLGEGYTVLEGTMNLVQALYLNNEVKPFDDVRVRQALSYAVDKNEIMTLVSDGKGTPIASSMFPAFGRYYMDELNDVYSYDPEKAKSLLAEAGYPDGFSFTITVPSNYTQHVDTAQVLAEQLKRINVKADIELVEWETWLSDAYVGRNYEATVVGIDASSMTARALLERFNSTADNNFINFKNKDYDEAFRNAISSPFEAEQTQYYKECETILTEEAANVYIQDIAQLVVLRDEYEGYEFYPIYVQDISKLYLVEEEE